MSLTLKNTDLHIALIGNPNAGKSTLFNALTGLSQKTGNYAGVTVDKYEGSTQFKSKSNNYSFLITDLPGTYSLYPKSIDERVACEFLVGENEKTDVVVVVVDATNLKRSLLLATQIIDLKYKTVIALNLIDEAEKQSIKINVEQLQVALGVEVIPIDSRHKTGIEAIKSAIVRAKVSDSFFYNISDETIQKLKSYRTLIGNYILDSKPHSEFENADKIYRFGLINYLITKYVATPKKLRLKDITSKIDAYATHKFYGYAFLILVLFLVFQFVFYVSEYPMNWIESFFIYLQELVKVNLPKGQLNDLIVNGVIAGVSGVVMFIPQIAFLFFFIGVLEDSGYMARASFIMDKLMRKFGLSGKSVIPLIGGTACAVPSIMATRSISNFKERLIAIFILPLISCSARLPVYTLVISLLYPTGTFFGVFNIKGLVLLFLYFLSFTITLTAAYVLKKIIKSKEASFFIMELPVYRVPQTKNISILVFNKVKVFIKDAGKIILALSIVLWFLSSHSFKNEFAEIQKQELKIEQQSPSKINDSLLNQLATKKLELSYVGQLGHFIEPVIKPLGFDWKIGIALITSFAAREVFVGTMATIYNSNSNEEIQGIKQKLRNEKDVNGKPKYTAAVCWSLLLFYAFALQCMSTVAVTKRETKSWKWTMAQFLFMTSLAYLSAFGVYQLLV
ncbi:MAG: ferrous iron transport protein B [Bacteroidota bacterium]|nr:ferrous iron transport protein B [Bacteroidota bacterium]